jgi:hypothetical protein
MSFAGSVSLIGQHGSLAPLSHVHHADLLEAVKDGELWNLWYTSIPMPDQMSVEIDRRLETVEMYRHRVSYSLLQPAKPHLTHQLRKPRC